MILAWCAISDGERVRQGHIPAWLRAPLPAAGSLWSHRRGGGFSCEVRL